MKRNGDTNFEYSKRFFSIGFVIFNGGSLFTFFSSAFDSSI